MSTIRFRSSAIDLELKGSESFVSRQLFRLTPYLGSVDGDALAPGPEDVPAQPQSASQSEMNGDRHVPPPEPMTSPAVNGDEPEDALVAFYSSFPSNSRDTQVDAALLFSYYLQNREGKATLGVGDLIRCCIRTGVDTRNFNRVLGTLMRRGFLEAVHGHAYQLSEQGLAAVESRM